MQGYQLAEQTGANTVIAASTNMITGELVYTFLPQNVVKIETNLRKCNAYTGIAEYSVNNTMQQVKPFT